MASMMILSYFMLLGFSVAQRWCSLPESAREDENPSEALIYLLDPAR